MIGCEHEDGVVEDACLFHRLNHLRDAVVENGLEAVIVVGIPSFVMALQIKTAIIEGEESRLLLLDIVGSLFIIFEGIAALFAVLRPVSATIIEHHIVDGKRVASEIDQNYELDRIPIDNIDHIEIVRGPSSSVHGTEAMAGVINIITKKSEKPTVSLSGDLSFWSHPGENGPKRYGFFVDSGHIGKFSARLSGFERKSTTAFFKDDGSTYEPYGSWKNFQGTLEYRPSSHETIEFTHSDTKEDTREFFYPNAAKNPLVFAEGYAEGYDRIQRHENSISYENKGDDGTGLFLRYYRTVMDKERDNINTKNGMPVGNPKLDKFGWVRAKRTINAFEGHYTWKAGSSHTLTFGGEYRPETFRGTAVRRNGGDFSVTGPMGQVQRGSTYHFYYSALYAEDEWKIDDRWLAFLSLRYDGNNQFDDNVSPKLGLTLRVAQHGQPRPRQRGGVLIRHFARKRVERQKREAHVLRQSREKSH